MKKIFVSIFALCTLVASAQEETSIESTSSSSGGGIFANSNQELSFTSKNGHEVLPQAGDWGIGISAANPLQFVGDIFGRTASNTNGSSPFQSVSNGPSFSNGTLNGAVGTTVLGKYFVNSHTAYRGWLTTQTSRTSELSSVADDGNPSEPKELLNDKLVTKTRGFIIGAGLEKRRGSGRLIGVYGVQAFIGLGQGQVQNYTYANAYSSTNATPSDAFGDNGQAVGGVAGDQRVLSRGAASEFTVGGQAFLGVEYFIAPKLSLGGEFNYGASYTPSIKSYEVVEFYNTSTSSAEEFTFNTEDGANVFTGTGVSGSLNLNFYF